MFVFLKVSWTLFLHFDIGVEEKPHVPRFGLCHVLSPFNKREGIHDSVSVKRIAFKD